ncbi:MAG: alpha/beta fold hydrolase [bacterium]
MPGKFLAIDSELTLHYEQAGYGDITVVMLPGWTMSTEVFEHQLKYFNRSTKYRFITVDPRAHGLSSKTEGGHFYEQHGRDLNVFIDKLDLNNIVLCGWSFGTLAALSYINQFGSDRLLGFVMLDGPPRTTGMDNKQDWVTYTYADSDGLKEFFTLERLRNKRKFNVEFANWMLEFRTKENIEWIVNITNQVPDNSAALLNATSDFLDYRKDLIDLSPKLPLIYIVRKERGEIVSNWAEENTPAARVVSFGEHMMFWERPNEFNSVFIDYLENCRLGADF